MNYKPCLIAHLRRFALWAVVASAVATAAAQSVSGALSGRVSSASTGQSLQGAIVRVVGSEFRADTQRDGSFDLVGLPPGRHDVEVTYFGLEAKRVSVEIVAGRPVEVNIALGSDVVQLDAFKVEAAVLGQARAVNIQRTAESMVNVTSEELFGEMTDNNVARALQRIPGISANSDGGTEIPRYVNIRGFDGSLNSVQLNGARLPTSGTGQGTVYGETARAFALDDLPANAITNIEIVKAPTPDMDGDSVGGIVNLVTKSALDREGGRSFDLNAGMDYIGLRKKWVPNFALGYSDLLLDRKLGVRLDVSYFKGDEGFDNIDYDSLPLVPQLEFNKHLKLPTGGRPVFAHEDTEYNTYLIERDRYGFATGLDYKLGDRSSVYFRSVYNYEVRDESDRRYHKIMDNQHGRTASAPPAGAAVGTVYTGTLGTAVVTAPGRGAYRTYESMSYDSGRTSLLPNGNGRGSAGYRQTLVERNIELLTLDIGGQHGVGAGELKWNFVRSGTTKDDDNESVRFDRNGMRWAYDRPDAKRPDYRVVNGFDPLGTPTRGAADFFISPSSSNITASERMVEETALQAKVDFSMPFPESTGIAGTFKTGAKARWMDRELDLNQNYWALTGFAGYDFASYLRPNSYTVSDFAMPYAPDTRLIMSEIRSGSANYSRDTSNARRVNLLAQDYEASEDSLEGYAMGIFKVGSKLSVTAGTRVEHTMFKATTPVYDARNVPLQTRATTRESRENDYTKVLPGVHFRYEARNNVVARVAYTQTYGRPSFRETIAVTSFDEVNNVISTGNPDLDPYDSVNWDFSIEYFGKQASYLQLAFFHKEVKNFVLETGSTIFGSAGFRGLDLNPNDTYTVNTFSNQHDSVNRGVEVAGRYRFVDLPAPFNGLHFDGSVTYTDSDGKYADRPGEKLPTYGASEWIYFTGLGYDIGRLSLFLSYRYRSDYLEGLESVDQQNRELGFPPDSGDDWWGPEKYWNLETSYRLTPKLRLYWNISNLAEYKNSSYQSPVKNNYPEDSYWHKRRMSFGIKARF
jgi:TonB-dependent receptor